MKAVSIRSPYLWVAFPFILLVMMLGVQLIWSWFNKPAAPSTGTVPPGPRVYAQVFIPKKPERLLTEPNLVPATSESDFEDFRRTQAALVRSQLVLNAALRPAEVAQLSIVRAQAEPLGWLAGALQVGFPESPEIMRVGLDGDNADELRVLVNAVVDAYLREVIDRESANLTNRLRRLEALIGQAEESVKRKRDQIRLLKSDASPSPDSLEQQLLTQDLLECHRELRRVRLAKAGADAAVMEAQTAKEKLLQDEEKTLLLKAAEWDRSRIDLTAQRAEVEHGEELLRRLMSARTTLLLQMDSPPRALLLERAVIRGKE